MIHTDHDSTRPTANMLPVINIGVTNLFLDLETYDKHQNPAVSGQQINNLQEPESKD